MSSEDSNAWEAMREDDVIDWESEEAEATSNGNKISQMSTESDSDMISSIEALSPPLANQLALKIKDSNIEHNSLTALRTILNNNDPQWTSPEQHCGVVATLKQETDIIAMLKTGGGGGPAFEVLDDRLGEKAQSHGSSVSNLRSQPTLVDQHQSHPGVRKQGQIQDMATIPCRFNKVLPVSRMVFDEAHL
ncbi:hypothetical protein EDD22DRAFT_954203 [Suillus occidentalis]|nr:hypothetical protein EDD22DRAFT_954203 [Suillus occidentalis]